MSSERHPLSGRDGELLKAVIEIGRAGGGVVDMLERQHELLARLAEMVITANLRIDLLAGRLPLNGVDHV